MEVNNYKQVTVHIPAWAMPHFEALCERYGGQSAYLRLAHVYFASLFSDTAFARELHKQELRKLEGSIW